MLTVMLRRIVCGLTLAAVGCSSERAAFESDAGADAAIEADSAPISFLDAGASDASFNPDAACAAAKAPAKTSPLPVDIIWVVDNSASMAPAVAELSQGINAFATTVGGKGLDYKVIMLSLRSTQSPIQVSGKTRYPVCVPQPLSGDANCGDGPNFVGVETDIYSTQPLEQFLGTLAQTKGYLQTDPRGSKPWLKELRPTATKTIIVVTDDNSRLSSGDFEKFPGGTNPGNPGLTLPAGILDPSWKGLFDNYVFGGIYGWGSQNDPGLLCTYPNNSKPPSSGSNYTALVTKTGGPRAKICDGAAAWSTFWNDVETAVLATSKISCTIDIPQPASQGAIDPHKVNVTLDDGMTQTLIGKVSDATACGPTGGWYYDQDINPTKVILCPASCAQAQTLVGLNKKGSVEVLFGCDTVAN